MTNPYAGSRPAVRRLKDFIQRKEESEQLRSNVISRTNTVIMGPEGSGKSSFLNCFFNLDFRQEMALEHNLLIASASFPAHLSDGNAMHTCFLDTIRYAANLLYDIDEAAAKALSQRIERDIRETTGAYSRLEKVCRSIYEAGYDVMLVIDDFENFTGSKNVEMSHHGELRSLIKNGLAYFVVATNYDFNQDSLPPDVSGSYLLMEFANNEVLLKGFTAEQCTEYLRMFDPEMPFNEKDINNILVQSGGIPALLRITASEVWEEKQSSPVLGKPQWDRIVSRLQANPQIQTYFRRWCTLFSQNQIQVIGKLLDKANFGGIITNSDIAPDAKVLVMRGLLVHGMDGGSESKDLYRFHSLLFKNFCKTTPLSTTSPHTAQEQNAISQLNQMIDNGDTEGVLQILQSVCSKMDNVTVPVSFDGEISEEMLRQFQLNLELLNSFPEDVQKFIRNGIRIERTFTHVKMNDYAAVYISFAKAIESLLNQTIVPILKRAVPNHPMDYTSLRQYKKTLMLGPLYNLLTTRVGALDTSIYQNAAQYCLEHNCASFDEVWWKNLTQALYSIKDIRNDIPHTTPLSSEDGVDLLRRLFGGSNAFVSKCTDVYRAMCAQPSTLLTLRIGMMLSGAVKEIRSTYAKIDLGLERDGYLNISEISTGYVQNIRSVLTMDQAVKVKVISIDPTNGGINVTMKGVSQT